MQVRVPNPDYKEWWDDYDPYAPIGMHIYAYRNSPSPYKYVNMTFKEWISYIIGKLFRRKR